MLGMGVRERASGRTATATPQRLRAAPGKSTDSDNLMATATAKPNSTVTRSTPHSPEAAALRLRRAASKSDSAPPRRTRRKRPPTPPRRPHGTGGLASDTARRRPGSAVPPGPGRGEAITAKPTARRRSRDEGSRASAHSRSTVPDPMCRPDSLSSDCRGPTDARRGRVSRPEKADIEELKTQFYRLLDAVLARALARAKRFKEWMDTLVEEVERGGPGMKAGLEGIRAALTGKNPVLAAIKGLWTGLSRPAKAALVLLVVLGLVL